MRNNFLKITKLSFVALVIASLTLMPGSAALANGAEQTEFTGTIGIFNGCAGESVGVTGTVKITYHANQTGSGKTHHNISLRLLGTGQGNLGNTYNAPFMADGQFDAPTQDFGSYQVFDMPFRSVFVSKGQAPNIEIEGTIRVFVAGGRAVGAYITAITKTNCQG